VPRSGSITANRPRISHSCVSPHVRDAERLLFQVAVAVRKIATHCCRVPC
jgi:hypothetical protein